ncbi:prolyl oligopeptidase family serine peptidase [Bifidobacterium sp. UBA4282]|uniref:prolyl oligopeptidase family serine peptidase n=1 Tax=Bifidobacterium sp. UBA4282 TaxID=1946096 RepID=UPI0025C07BDD|nr:prolyl oligopeptidase family serine peptidase [Bifidobacterium sp. UBA4282]
MDELIASQAIAAFPRRKARTLRFTSGAPRSAQAIGDGTRALFLRSDGPEDLVTALWLSVWSADGAEHREVLLADPRRLLADADSEEVSEEEKARRERAREGGQGIVSYSVDAAGRRVAFTINGQLFVTEINADGTGGVTREVALADPQLSVIMPRISPDGQLIAYTTGSEVRVIALGADASQDEDWAVIGIDEDECTYPDQSVGLAEFVAGEEMDRYEGFWWSPDSRALLVQSTDEEPEPLWHISDPADPSKPAVARRYARALTRNAIVSLAYVDFTVLPAAEPQPAPVPSDEEDPLAFSDFTEPRVQVCNVADIDWDHETYEYLAAVNWSKGHEPLLLVQDRLQHHDQVLEVQLKAAGFHAGVDTEAVIGEPIATRVLEEHENPQWLDLVHGTPAFTPDGRLICAVNDMAHDTNRLSVDGVPFTPVGWQVRQVLDVTDTDVLAVVSRTPELAGEAGLGDDADLYDARSCDVVSFDYHGAVTQWTSRPGIWTASRCGKGMVLSGRDMSAPYAMMSHSLCLPETVDPVSSAEAGEPVMAGGKAVAAIANHAADPGITPNTTFVTLPSEHRLLAAITAPSENSPYAQSETLPVLLKPYGGPGAQQVLFSQAYYWESQWWADQGFLVVTVDGRGTPGRGPKWDRAIYETMKDVTLADQVEAVRALPALWSADAAVPSVCWTPREGARLVVCGSGATVPQLDLVRRNGPLACPKPDLDKVAMIGWSYGGFLSALAVLDAPDVVHAACAGAPPTDWTLYDTHYTERYLGLDPEVYRRNGIVEDAPKLRRPLMLIHGFADDNVTIAHSLRLSQALMAAGRPHTFLPLTGITHMTNDETVAENLLILQRDFLYDALDMR